MEHLQRIPFKTRKAVFDRLEKIVDIASLTKEEREMYDHSIKQYRDTMAVMKTERNAGFMEGERKGRKEGREEGERLKQRQIAKQLKALGLPIETIVQGTGLSKEEIEEL